MARETDNFVTRDAFFALAIMTTGLLSIVGCGLAVFHSYLAMTNQTTYQIIQQDRYRSENVQSLEHASAEEIAFEDQGCEWAFERWNRGTTENLRLFLLGTYPE
jgi:hypothetical protein